MKTTLFTAVLILLSVAGYAQSSTPKLKHLPPVEKKELDLEYLGKGSSSVLERVRGNDAGNTSLQKPPLSIKKSTGAEPKKQHHKSMPIMQPDANVHFPLLAAKPDSAVHYHMQVKKPE